MQLAVLVVKPVAARELLKVPQGYQPSLPLWAVGQCLGGKPPSSSSSYHYHHHHHHHHHHFIITCTTMSSMHLRKNPLFHLLMPTATSCPVNMPSSTQLQIQNTKYKTQNTCRVHTVANTFKIPATCVSHFTKVPQTVGNIYKSMIS